RTGPLLYREFKVSNRIIISTHPVIRPSEGVVNCRVLWCQLFGGLCISKRLRWITSKFSQDICQVVENHCVERFDCQDLSKVLDSKFMIARSLLDQGELGCGGSFRRPVHQRSDPATGIL